jgi:hypothetical protein
LEFWDQIDQAFADGNIVSALQRSARISEEPTPRIREDFGL